jgi:hypothetical protein
LFAINLISYFLLGVVILRLFIGILVYVVYVVPAIEVAAVMLAAFILVEGIH